MRFQIRHLQRILTSPSFAVRAIEGIFFHVKCKGKIICTLHERSCLKRPRCTMYTRAGFFRTLQKSTFVGREKIVSNEFLVKIDLLMRGRSKKYASPALIRRTM
jgi:hypothetical protein